MRNLHRTAALGMTLAAAFLAGCASEKRQEAALARMGDESPPDFLVGPASAALTNFDGFSANVVSTTSAAALRQPARCSGQLIERQGRFIFQPPATANIKKGKIVRGGMFFIWDSGRPARLCGERGAAGVRPDFRSFPDHHRDAGEQ